MKKIITILLILPIWVFAGLDFLKVHSALSSIKSSKIPSSTLKFYSSDKSLDLKTELAFTSQKSADIVLFPKREKVNKVSVVNSYTALKKDTNSIGAIYVKKGRTQIVFVKERLQKNGFDLMKVSKKYLIPECQLKSICLLTK